MGGAGLRINADTVTYTVRPHSAAAVPVAVLSMALTLAHAHRCYLYHYTTARQHTTSYAASMAHIQDARHNTYRNDSITAHIVQQGSGNAGRDIYNGRLTPLRHYV